MKSKWIGLVLVILMVGTVMGLAGCGKTSGDGGGTIKIATKPMTEQLILGEMLKSLIEQDTNLTVELTKGVGGGTSNIHPAMVKGDFDLYPEYTGTGWLTVLKKTEVPDDDTLYKKLAEEYDSQYSLEWTGLYGFNNTYTLAVRKEIADQYNIKTFTDLVKYAPELTFGANPDFFEREDGYTGITGLYGYTFKDTKEMDIGLKYKALANGEVDVIPAFTTDGQLVSSNATVLEDDQHYFKNYYCGSVVRQDVLDKYPELEKVLMKMDGLINDEDMRKMNAAVEVDGKEDVTVAHDFLVQKGLLNE